MIWSTSYYGDCDISTRSSVFNGSNASSVVFGNQSPLKPATLMQQLSQYDAASSRQDQQLLAQPSGYPLGGVGYSPTPVVPPQRKVSMLKELLGDVRGYIREHKDLLFTVVFVLVLDEYVFDGAFRDRLKALIAGMLRKVETKTGLDIRGV